jgi:quercetin dioxygenase-like cupin family protein
MTADETRKAHAPGQTTGSPMRGPQQLRGPLLTFDLAAEAGQLRAELAYQAGERSANTLVKAPDLRVVLTAMRAGARLKEHDAAARISIQTLSGRLRLHVADEPVELPAGHLLVLDHDLVHDVEALEDCVFLLTVAWQADRAATT